MSEMHSLIEIALERYDADKIGIPDYALESAGNTFPRVTYEQITVEDVQYMLGAYLSTVGDFQKRGKASLSTIQDTHRRHIVCLGGS